ncbi:Saccharopine dehydrogenase-domain-containing protein [Xylariomycetidae sp. FL2044]|nr:Saccharopine dehydrogenase-domain-containing protein [Xylariomycetidae sp. FL2044]
MTDAKSSRKYGILLMGATGYTGILIAEHIAANLPTDLRWAISGTSQTKLERLAEKLSKFGDRLQPEIEVVSVEDENRLNSVISQSRVCISSVLYSLAGEQIVRACAENGTDYVDVAAIPILVQTWIRKYHDKAKETGAALIHACGALITPLDIMVWLAAQEIEVKWSLKLRDVVLRLDELDTNISGGTMRTVINNAALGLKATRQAEQPSALSPVNHPGTLTAKRGVHHHPSLGWLTASSVTADQDRALIYRTWGLLQGTNKNYGPNFSFNEYEKSSSVLGGVGLILQSYLIGFVMSLARIPFLRSMMLSAAAEPGNGPDVELARKIAVTMEAVAIADQSGGGSSKQAHVKFIYPNGHYPVSALFAAQAAASLLYGKDLEGGLPGGCLTPAILGRDFVERCQSVGCHWTVDLQEK